MASLDEIRRAYLEGIKDGLHDVAKEVVDDATRIIDSEATDKGDLADSWEIRDKGPLEIEVAWTAAHARYVHDGTGPQHHPDARARYWPPFEAIKAWVKRNIRVLPLTGKALFKTQLRSGTRKATRSEVDKVARAVQAKIHRDGTEPVLFATRAVKGVQPLKQALIDRAVEERLRRL